MEPSSPNPYYTHTSECLSTRPLSSPPLNGQSINEDTDRLSVAVEESPPSSLCLSLDEESGKPNELCQVTQRLSLSVSHKEEDNDVDYHPSYLSELHNWETMPWIPLDRICHFLRTERNCTNLLNLSQISTHFRKGVKEFMGRASNRPTLDKVYVDKEMDGSVKVEIALFPSNISFHYLESLDWRRFERVKTRCGSTLRVTLHGLDDPVVEQVIGLLSARSWQFRASAKYEPLSSQEVELIARLLSVSTVDDISLKEVTIDDVTVPLIMSIISNSSPKRLTVWTNQKSMHSDPISFISHVCSSVSHVSIKCFSSSLLFFGLDLTFWESFLNENLASGSFEYIKMCDETGKMTTGPFDLHADTLIFSIEWKRRTT